MIPEINLHHIYTGTADIHSGSKLSGELSYIFSSQLTCVIAPPGYHKTSYIRSFLKSSEVPVLWVNLHASSDPVKSFWTVFLNSAGKLSPAAELIFSGMLPPADSAETAHILDLLESLFTGRQLYIVLEHYDMLESPELDRHLQYVTELCSSRPLHFILLSRRLPKLISSSYMTLENCNVIDKSIFAFTPAGINTISRVGGSHWTVSDCTWLAEYTHGWPNLIESIITSSVTDGMYRKYIMRVCVSAFRSVAREQLSSTEKEMLMILAHLGEFTSNQANEIIGLTDSVEMQDLLDHLYYETVFLERNAGIYSIHGAPADYLKEEAALEPRRASGRYAVWEKNLSNWYLANMRISEAVQMFYQKEKYEEMLNVLDGYTIENLTDSGLELIADSVQSLDSGLLDKHPIAAIQMCFLLLKSDRYSAFGTQCLKEARNRIPAEGLCGYDRDTLLGSIDVALSANADPELRFSSLIRMTAGPDSGPNSVPLTWIVPSFLYGIHREAGALDRELEDFGRICRKPHDQYQDLFSGCYNIARSEAEMHRGHFTKSIYYALEALSGSRSSRSLFVGMCAYFLMARDSLLWDQKERVPVLLENLDRYLDNVSEPRLLSLKDLCIGFICSCTREWDKIPAWILRDDKDTIRISAMSSYGNIIRARKLLAEGKALDFELQAAKWHGEMENNENLIPRIYYRILKSISAMSLYGPDQAVELLAAAFDLAVPDGIQAPFLENGAELLPIIDYLRKKKQYALPEAYAGEFDANLAPVRRLSPVVIRDEEKLTNRELEIITLLGQGLNNRDIAGALSISEFTVRKHVQNIYSKLNVSNKVNALIRARELYDI